MSFKKKLFLKYAIFLLATFTNIKADANKITEIECKLIPINRHRRKPDDTFPSHSSYPRIPIEMASANSINWCGYVSSTNLANQQPNVVTEARGTWRVPRIFNTCKNHYCAIWAGIDGFNNPTVEQIGTEQDCINGVQTNYAWFEMYPRSAHLISGFPVGIGDLIIVSVKYLGNNVFRLAITNYTKNVRTIIPTSFTTMGNTRRSSAEWIVEAPYLNGILPLGNFQRINFSNCISRIKGIIGSISNSHWQNNPIRMITRTGILKANPSALSNAGRNFFCSWHHS